MPHTLTSFIELFHFLVEEFLSTRLRQEKFTYANLTSRMIQSEIAGQDSKIKDINVQYMFIVPLCLAKLCNITELKMV